MTFLGKLSELVVNTQKQAAKLMRIAADLAVVVPSVFWLAVFLRGTKAELFDCLAFFFVFERALLFFPTGKIQSTAG